MKKGIVLVALAMMVVVWGAGAQNFEFDLRLDTKLDNREYDALKYVGSVPSITFFSMRVAPAIGIGFGDADRRHRVMVGASYTRDMGAAVSRRTPEPLIYYNFRSDLYGLWAGKFERRHLTGAYSRAIYAGSHLFYDNVIDGFAVQYTPRRGRLELVLDRDGRRSSSTRESFRVISAGDWNPVAEGPLRWLTGGYSFDMYRLASRRGESDGIVDHILVDASVGAALERVLPWFDKLTVKAGWAGSFDRERSGENRWLTPGGFTTDVTVQKKKLGIRNMFYHGEPLWSLWHAYGSRVYKGDPFFVVSGLNNYTMIYWHPQLWRGGVLRLELGMHTDGHNVGLQQVAWIGVSLDSSFFKRNP
ncbi:MAG: hypothetical protein LBU98_06370 [Alistipes sp.]|nr:hypothetical protein [Alistipes sp.]